MTQIPLGKDGKFFTIVDDQDVSFVNQNRWGRHRGRGTWYASRLIHRQGKPAKRIYLHREILCANRGLKVDHRDGDGLNNARDNLRVATNSQNHQGKMTRPLHFKSRFRGVYWHKQNKNWCAQIKCNYKKSHIGSFCREEDAARAYDLTARKLFGAFAQLNFPS